MGEVQRLIDRVDEYLNDAELKMQELQGKGRLLGAKAKLEYEEQMEQLRAEKRQLQQWMREKQESSSGEWESFKERLDRSTHELKEGIDSALKEWREK